MVFARRTGKTPGSDWAGLGGGAVAAAVTVTIATLRRSRSHGRSELTKAGVRVWLPSAAGPAGAASAARRPVEDEHPVSAWPAASSGLERHWRRSARGTRGRASSLPVLMRLTSQAGRGPAALTVGLAGTFQGVRRPQHLHVDRRRPPAPAGTEDLPVDVTSRGGPRCLPSPPGRQRS